MRHHTLAPRGHLHVPRAHVRAPSCRGMYGGWAEGSLVSVERVLAFHVGLPKPEWLSQEYYDDTVLQMDVSKERQAAYDAQHVE
eukprot:COSAG01_NODE_6878_length_3457_cov_1.360631_5_plen_84_part_00